MGGVVWSGDWGCTGEAPMMMNRGSMGLAMLATGLGMRTVAVAVNQKPTPHTVAAVAGHPNPAGERVDPPSKTPNYKYVAGDIWSQARFAAAEEKRRRRMAKRAAIAARATSGRKVRR